MRLERRPRRAHGGQHATPVGVVAEHRALDEVVARDGAGHLQCVRLGGGAADLDGDVVVGALGVGDELAGQAGAHLGDGVGQRFRACGDTGRARREGTTVSLVDWQPSESMRSNVVAVAVRSTASSAPGSTTASVVTTTSIVARAGASMPAPLAMPPTLQPSRTACACLWTVSVVVMAMAASPPVGLNAAAAASTRRAAAASAAARR